MMIEMQTPCGGVHIHLLNAASATLTPLPGWTHRSNAKAVQWEASASRQNGHWNVYVRWLETQGFPADLNKRRRSTIVLECQAALMELSRGQLVEAERRFWSQRMSMLPAEVQAAEARWMAVRGELVEAEKMFHSLSEEAHPGERRLKGD
jgi:hypothetical protein